MQIIQKENTESFSLPLPIYKTIHIADALGENGEKFYILIGLDKELVGQLEKFSADDSDIDLQKYTKDKQRFVLNKYEDWYKKNRTPFVLVHKTTGSLAAIMRFGPEHLFNEVSNWHTVGWRSYIPWRGKSIMKDFAEFTFDFYVKYFPNTRFWICAKAENAGSIKLAAFLGFKIDEERSKKETELEEKETLIMIKE